jgi:hypothetical protein
MVRAPRGFVDQALWPEFGELDRALSSEWCVRATVAVAARARSWRVPVRFAETGVRALADAEPRQRRLHPVDDPGFT